MFILLLAASAGTPDPPPVVPDPPPISGGVVVQPQPAATTIQGYRPVLFDGVRWVYEREVSRSATPFSTPTTPVIGVGVVSTGYQGSTATARTITLAPGAATSGGTNCPTGVG